MMYGYKRNRGSKFNPRNSRIIRDQKVHFQCLYSLNVQQRDDVIARLMGGPNLKWKEERKYSRNRLTKRNQTIWDKRWFSKSLFIECSPKRRCNRAIKRMIYLHNQSANTNSRLTMTIIWKMLWWIAAALWLSDASLQVSTGLPDEQMHLREDYIPSHNILKAKYLL